MTLSELNLVVSDSCEPCPVNGECHQGKLQCNHGYRKQGTLCIEDGAIFESTKKLVTFRTKKEKNILDVCVVDYYILLLVVLLIRLGISRERFVRHMLLMNAMVLTPFGYVSASSLTIVLLIIILVIVCEASIF